MTYSLEQRKRAVEMCASGRRPADVIRELGYPSRSALLSWRREFARTGRLQDPRERAAKYSAGQREAAVEHWLSHGRCMARTARELGYPSDWRTLALWIDELAPGERRLRPDAGRPRGDGPGAKPYDVRVAAVVALLARERTAGEIAGALGVPRRTLYTWKRELLGEGVPCRMEREHEPGADAAALEARVEELEAQVRKLELRKAILEGTVELLGKDPGADPNRLTNREKTLLIDSIRPDWPLGALLAELGLARSSYQYQVAAIAAGDRRADLRREVREVFEGSGGTYGRRRIRDALAARGVHAGERAVARIMEEEGLVARCSRRRRRGYSSYKGEISEHPGNLVRRDFRAALPNFLWLTDVTQFSIPAGRVYLSPIVDCFDGAVVSWTMSTSPDAELANSMLEAALAKLPDGQGGHLVIHSDCGCHYRWPGWIAICERAGVTRSMSAKGCSPDNAAMEGFFGRLKTEMFYDRDWSGVTVEGFEEEVGAYIRWYNEGRIKRSLGGKSPMEYRASLGLEL